MSASQSLLRTLVVPPLGLTLVGILPHPNAAQIGFDAVPQASGTEVLLQAVSPVDDRVVWISGHGGTWGLTVDGGSAWSTGTVPGAIELEFRDVEGFDRSSAVLLAAGPGDRSRLFRTDDGGASWAETWVMTEPEGFLDCLGFLDRDRGFAYGDAVDGLLFVLETDDGGRSWSRIPASRLPAALEGEGGFAASGSCVATAGEGTVFVATGNGPGPRLIRSDDAGRSWGATPLPLTAGPAAGATAIGFEDPDFAWVVGGAIGDPIPGSRVAISSDGGLSWSPSAEPPLDSPLYGAAVSRTAAGRSMVVAGPDGLAATADGGATWTRLHTESHWAIAFGPDGSGWAVGPRGRITFLRPHGGPRPEEPS